MHPYDHARSSARLHGGAWEDYVAFHDWFDVTKSVWCHFTHRALRHHREGIAEARALFGETIATTAGQHVSTETLGIQHLHEDCAHVPDARDWLIQYKVPDWFPRLIPGTDTLCEDSARRFGGVPEDYRHLHDWFANSLTWADTPAALIFRHHSFGCFEAEHCFGHILSLTGGGGIPTRVIVERRLQRLFDRLPAASDMLRHIHGERWMLQATSPRKLGLE